MKIAIVMGSDSDLHVMEDAYKVLKEFDIPFHTQVLSAHRTPEDMIEFGKKAKSNGFDILIAGAGGAAHLPGMLASTTTLPVIGVPIKLKNLDGMDSLLSIVQMPKGVPVATVAINNAYNAALLALSILAINDQELSQKLEEFKESMADKSRAKNTLI
jgi:phosphoribosylaminoimidazole carboxylase PurE protein